jgi:hypothetical protein
MDAHDLYFFTLPAAYLYDTVTYLICLTRFVTMVVA